MLKSNPNLKAVDFFCGAGGMSFGLLNAGIQVIAGIDNDVKCRETYEANVVGAQFIKHDISTLSAVSLGQRLNIQMDDPNLIFAGCSPCQFWSMVRTDKTKSARTAFLLKQFQKFIRHFRPGFVVVENVPGLRSRTKSSVLPGFIEFLTKLGYAFDDGVVNANHYGVPQNRRRYLLIATRLAKSISLPAPQSDAKAIVSSYIGVKNGFSQIAAGTRDETAFQHTTCGLSDLNLRRIKLTPKSGGTRAAWKDIEELQINAYRGKDDIFEDVYGRMHWDRPAPTITTKFNSISNGRFGHPEEDRGISIREGATLQTFPKSFVFYGSSLSCLARQVGNAVPPEMARRIGSHLISLATHLPCRLIGETHG
jgi:DNA (cytosine-5)-methyltransferase 1